VHIREAGHQVAATTVNALRTGGNHDPTTDVDDSAVTDEHRDIARDPVAGQRDDVDVCECERSTRGRAAPLGQPRTVRKKIPEESRDSGSGPRRLQLRT